MGVHLLESDFGLYILGEGPDALYLALYVNELKICGVKAGLGKKYNMKDLGEAKFFLGLEIRRQPKNDLFLCQEKYGRELLDKFGMREYNSVSTPLEIGEVFRKFGGGC